MKSSRNIIYVGTYILNYAHVKRYTYTNMYDLYE